MEAIMKELMEKGFERCIAREAAKEILQRNITVDEWLNEDEDCLDEDSAAYVAYFS